MPVVLASPMVMIMDVAMVMDMDMAGLAVARIAPRHARVMSASTLVQAMTCEP